MPKIINILPRLFFVSAFVFLWFSLGVVSAHYKWAPSTLYVHVLAEYENWKQEIRRSRHRDSLATKLSYADTEIIDPGKAYLGYTLVAMGDDTLAMIDAKGRVAHRWSMPYKKLFADDPLKNTAKDKKAPYFIYAYLYPNGDVLGIYHGTNKRGYGYGLVKMDKESHLIWKVLDKVHHDLYVADDRRLYTLTHTWANSGAPGAGILEDFILILSDEGKEQQKISIPDAFRGTPYEQLVFNKEPKSKRGDFTDASSVMVLEKRIADKFPMFKAGQILVSLNNQHCIAIIDPESKKVIWAMRSVWKDQKKAVFLENGNILVYDSKGYYDGAEIDSRLLEVNPVTQAIEWKYDSRNAGNLGNIQVLPNGNYLIIHKNRGRMIELTHDKEIVWKSLFDKPVSSAWRIRYEDLDINFWGKVQPRTAEDQVSHDKKNGSLTPMPESGESPPESDNGTTEDESALEPAVNTPAAEAPAEEAGEEDEEDSEEGEEGDEEEN
jgi:hypothetical protein